MKSKQEQRTQKIWLAIRFHALPLNALSIDDYSPACAVVDKNTIICINKNACVQGVKNGMNSTTAQALCNCTILPRNTALEQQVTEYLCAKLYRFTPYIETYTSPHLPDTGLLLELSRCLKLFSGLKPLCTQIFNLLNTENYTFTYGLGHTSAAAWVLSWQQHAVAGTENRDLFLRRLRCTPLEHLHDFPKAVSSLRKAGFKTLEDITKQITHQSLAVFRKRYGTLFSEHLSQLFDIDKNLQQARLFETPATIFTPEDFFLETLQFGYPVTITEQLFQPMEIMLQKLTRYLITQQKQCQKIIWRLYDIHNNQETVNIFFDRQHSNWSHLLELTQIQFNNRELPFEVDTIELICNQTTLLENPHQALNFSQKKIFNADDFAITAAKLTARLGSNAISKISFYDSHIPERSNEFIPIQYESQQELPSRNKIANRPSWLFDPPIIIHKKNSRLYWQGYIELQSKPERIDSNWWDTPTHRDYFLAQRDDHLPLWVFYDRKHKNWCVHGVFG